MLHLANNLVPCLDQLGNQVGQDCQDVWSEPKQKACVPFGISTSRQISMDQTACASLISTSISFFKMFVKCLPQCKMSPAIMDLI